MYYFLRLRAVSFYRGSSDRAVLTTDFPLRGFHIRHERQTPSRSHARDPRYKFLLYAYLQQADDANTESLYYLVRNQFQRKSRRLKVSAQVDVNAMLHPERAASSRWTVGGQFSIESRDPIHAIRL
jgi:hypothetical protein